MGLSRDQFAATVEVARRRAIEQIEEDRVFRRDTPAGRSAQDVLWLCEAVGYYRRQVGLWEEAFSSARKLAAAEGLV